MPHTSDHPIAPARLPALLVPLVVVLAIVACALTAQLPNARLPLALRVLPWSALALTVGLFAVSVHGARHGRIVLTADGLCLRGDVYGRRVVPYADLTVGQARVVDVEAERTLQPVLRLFGTGLPGYRAGWFQLRGGGRALCAVTTRDRVLHLPTRRGYAMLLSARDPEALLAALRERQPRETRTAPTA